MSEKLLPSSHDAIKWVSKEDIDYYDFAPADIPLVELIKADTQLLG